MNLGPSAALALFTAVCAALPAAAQPPDRPEWERAAAAEAACRAGINPGSYDDFVLEPVTVLRVDGLPMPVDGTLCVTRSVNERDGYWYWLDYVSDTVRRINPDLGGGANLGGARALRVSPDGGYLAVEMLSEALSYVDIVDLPALIRDEIYRSAGTLGGFPGSVSIVDWTLEGRLRVSGDTLLSHDGRSESGSKLEIFDDEVFVWDIAEGGVVPESVALRDPLRYNCDHLLAPYPQTRMIAADNLRHFPSEPVVACLVEALGLEAAESIHAEIRRLLSDLAGE